MLFQIPFFHESLRTHVTLKFFHAFMNPFHVLFQITLMAKRFVTLITIEILFRNVDCFLMKFQMGWSSKCFITKATSGINFSFSLFFLLFCFRLNFGNFENGLKLSNVSMYHEGFSRIGALYSYLIKNCCFLS